MPKHENCQDCPLLLRNEVRFQRGQERGLMILGQSPAQEEVNQGRVFAGRTGKLLDAVLKRVGLRREDITIANALRCQEGIPGLTGKDLRTAISSCKFQRDATRETVKPRLIVAMGNHAILALTGKSGITNKRGKITTMVDGTPVFPTLHPAAILRESTRDYPNKDKETMSNREKEFLEDWERIAAIVQADYNLTEEAEAVDYGALNGEVISIKDYTDLAEHQGPLSIDCETTGVDMNDPNFRVLGISWSLGKGHARCIKSDCSFYPTFLEMIRHKLTDRNIKVYVAARPFDEYALSPRPAILATHNVHDVLVMAHLVDENYHAFNLENVAALHVGMRDIKAKAQGFRTNLEEAPENVFMEYSCTDADATLRAGLALDAKLDLNITRRRYYDSFLHPVQNMFCALQSDGCAVNLNTLHRNKEEAQLMLAELEAQMCALVPPDIVATEDMNFNRLALLRRIIFDPWSHRRPVAGFVTEKTGEPQITAEHLKHFVGDPFVDAYLRWKKLSKIYNSYLDTIESSIRDGRIYPKTVLTRTVTGRTVMLDPAIQTFPGRGEFARLIREPIVPDPGNVLMAFDLAQSELRIIGWLAKDVNILDALKNKVDLHTLTASVQYDVPIAQVTEEMRRFAKIVNFGLVYGMSAYTLQGHLKSVGVDKTDEECQEIREKFFSYPLGFYKLPDFYKRMESQAQRNGLVLSPIGRARHLPGIYSPDAKVRSEAARQAINFPVQSFSSDLGLLAMLLIYRQHHQIRPMWFIHDAVIMQVPEDEVRFSATCVEHTVKHDTVTFLEEEFQLQLGYPIECDIKVGYNWANMMKLEKFLETPHDKMGLII